MQTESPVTAEVNASPLALPEQDARKAYIVSLGCAKNLVDTERYVSNLHKQGYELTSSPEQADLLFVNTCSFIDIAKEESVNTILELSENKRPGQSLVVAGCLVDRYREELLEELPEVDLWTDLERFVDFPQQFATLSPLPVLDDYQPLRLAPEESSTRSIPWAGFPRAALTPRHTAYLKISEGCDHTCSFCAIPSFKGKQRSVPPEILLEEACALVSAGAMEITLIGQDTVAYGKDLSQDRSINLRFLLERLSEIEGVQWLRVLYTYPTRLADELEWAYRNLPACIPYLDLPLQHLSDPVLVRMRRGTPYNSIRDHIGRLREAVPNLVVRSTCIVGFPGETEEDLAILQERFSELEVDHLGVFRYSDEEGTRGFDLPDKVDPEVAESRYEWMTAWAASFCQVRGGLRVGQEYEILVDRPALPPTDLFPEIEPSGQWWQGRWWGQAPEIDGSVFFRSETASAGRLVNVHLASVSYPDYLGAVVEL